MDTLTWALPLGEPNTIDPPNAAYYSSGLVANNVCESLLRLNADYSISDGLASLSKPTPTTLRLKLRTDVTFWDGAPMTSADVVWSLEHTRKSVVGPLYANVKSIRAVDRYTVELDMIRPDRLLPKEFASFSASVQQKRFSERAGDKLGTPGTGVMCTGPYRFGSWKPGAGITLTANPNYWDTSRAAKASTVNVKFLTDSSALGQALKTGGVDGAYEVPAALVPALNDVGAGTLTLGSPSQQYVGLSPMRRDGPLDTPDLRKAFFMTINRSDLAKGPFHGAAEPNYTALNTSAWDNPSLDEADRTQWRKAYEGFANERKDWGTSTAIAEAKQLAKSAGYDNKPITLAIPAGDQAFSQMAVLIGQQAGKAGFNVKIRSLDPASYSAATTDPAARADIDLYLNLSFNVAPDPLEAVTTFVPGTYFNFIGYDNPAVTSLIAKARTADDSAAAAGDLIAAQAKYEENYGFQALVQLNEISFLKKGLGGMTTSFAYLNQPSLASIGPQK
ncbi:ABC transporter substrate-binding protein [Streptomyces acidiscabies]|uniref:ABC transporter substrate-binding protein n=1 Tax=Streptomyces acidiscabies TaxID=42234 RepID=UPI00067D5E24|nr:ABC transporter substrate-binding protein [Streptomyces acidiscabies]